MTPEEAEARMQQMADEMQASIDAEKGAHRESEVCPKCGLKISGVSYSDPEQAAERLKNNIGAHRRGSRCWKRQRAQKEAESICGALLMDTQVAGIVIGVCQRSPKHEGDHEDRGQTWT